MIRQLRDENHYLRTQYMILKQMMDSLGVKKPRKAPAKKAPAKHGSPRVKGGTPRQRAAFQAGYNDLTRGH